ncbi:MAG: efflux RND transporter permease subunit [bacterium]|nr:efflux RND transporter permease subunit [bacterium]
MKSISEVFINKPITTILIIVAVLVFGTIAYFKLPVASLPNMQNPYITIYASYPGATPKIMSTKVSSPIVKQCMQIPGLEKISSDNTYGQTSIYLKFKYSTDINNVIPKVQSALQRAKGDLPDLPNDPVFYTDNTSDIPIVIYLFYSDSLSNRDLTELINKRISQPMNMLPGVSDVQTYSPSFAVYIKLDPGKMAIYDVTLAEIKQAVTSASQMSPGGELDGNFKNMKIQPEGQLTTVAGYNNIVIKYDKGHKITISDIGEAYKAPEDDTQSMKFVIDGKVVGTNASFVQVQVQKKPSANTISVSNEVNNLIKNVQKTLPDSVHGSTILDFSTTVKDSVFDVKITLIFAFILVLLSIFLFLGRLTETIIPGIILPISIIGTFAGMYIFGFSIDNLSLLALTLSIGFIVDDSIVVLENTVRHIELGEQPFDAAIKSTREITASVISMSTAVGIVFIPLIFAPGVIGQTFKEFALTVIITVICSGLLSLTLTPMMNAHILNPVTTTKKSKLQKGRDIILDYIVSKYSRILNFFLKRPYVSVAIWILCIAGTIFFYQNVNKTFIPSGDSGFIQGSFVAPVGTSQKQMKIYRDYIFNILKKDKDIATCVARTQGSNTGRIMILLKPINKRKPIDEELAYLYKKFKTIPYNLGSIYLFKFPVLLLNMGSDNSSGGAYTVSGSDSTQVYKYAAILKDRLKKNSDFTSVKTNVNINSPQLTVHILRNRAAALGVTVTQIENLLAAAYTKVKATDFNEGSEVYNVYLQLNKKYRKTPEDLSYMYLKSSSGKLVPLSVVATWNETLGPDSINKTNQLVQAEVSFDLAPGVPMSKATKTVNKIAKEILPINITGSFSGTAEQFMKTTASLPYIICISIFLLYILLGILYESFIHPFTVLTTLPTATVGGLGTLYFFNSDLTLFAYVGMLLLLGIVAKNGIMMIDFAIQEMDNKGKNSFDSIHSACLTRFRPILMTGVTSILGAVPIAIGLGANGSIRSSLGLMIIGGLVVAQVVTLFVTPGIFIYMQKLQDKYLNRFRITRTRKAKLLHLDDKLKINTTNIVNSNSTK